ncbi:glycosyltransferase family 2 protein [Flavobacterium sp. DSR2-3-3]|uniref:glycosyltransferase family 2 protein n=1 Tax=Flavobacterium sp. DSR2-3-3 TaxID=2804632 RepID=UPI003CF1F7B1
MIIVYHQNAKIIDVVSINNQKIKFDYKLTIAAGLHVLAQQFPDKKILWCSSNVKEQLNIEEIQTLFHHNKMMLSYTPNSTNYLGSKIGYVEESPFIKINKKVSYPTWQMSSLVGVVHASVLIAIKDKIKLDSDFEYYLNSVAKVCMPLGLLCYSEPKLLMKMSVFDEQSASGYTLFKFVKQHYRGRWILILLLNLLIYEGKFPLLACLYSGFFKNRNGKRNYLDVIAVQSSLKVFDGETIDVVIPTIGRKEYLYNVLCDLREQTHLPKNVIIIEQNPVPESKSELDYLHDEKWPFAIDHTFTHQPGACNARNIALSKVESEWVFLADDDVRFNNVFVHETLKHIKNYGLKTVSINCSHQKEIQTYTKIFQWGSFGSGCSVVLSKSLKKCQFNLGFEFGYGEDSDFGMQLRNNGVDVLYLPKPTMLHLRAPIGGFRTKPKLAWDDDEIMPKPSPTIILFKLMHNTKEQLSGYKTILFFKYYKHQKHKNPIQYYKMFQKQWNQSLFWANQLIKTS